MNWEYICWERFSCYKFTSFWLGCLKANYKSCFHNFYLNITFQVLNAHNLHIINEVSCFLATHSRELQFHGIMLPKLNRFLISRNTNYLFFKHIIKLVAECGDANTFGIIYRCYQCIVRLHNKCCNNTSLLLIYV